ncbi:hypothetical protein LTR46_008332 [Exophiala xenobiotica]|nr:hypothetical protein LTR46_008332 [Exophiala xenobiotica]
MAKSLDDLIEFLLEEIAVSGIQGLTINDIAKSVSTFYHDVDNQNQIGAVGEQSSTSTINVDRHLLGKIWTWLGRHPDVSIGENKKYNKTSLDQIELDFPGFLNATVGEGRRPPENTGDSNEVRDDSPTIKAHSEDKKQYQSAQGPRFSVNQERIYHAICGHPPDITKVAPMEFVLLSQIAATRSNGILQGELTRLTGQDKRSVPKRTDSLQRKGYIIKEVIYRKGNRTSRLVLKKFASPRADDAENVHNQHEQPQRGSSVRDAVRRIFDILSEQNLISQMKLAEELNLKSVAESAVLVKIIRRLDRLKCLKRVRTAMGPSATSGDLQHFVQILHRPKSEDLEKFDTDELSLDQIVQQLSSQLEPDDQEDPGARPENSENQTPTQHLARWNPDRTMTNTIVDAARLSGQDGLTHMSSRHLITGIFVRRVMESMLARLSFQSLIVQPAHLRHLAVIRTVVTVDGIAQYTHYSWEAFCDLANKHAIDISQIPGAKQALDARRDYEYDADDVERPTTTKHKDEFGFPIQTVLPLQIKNGEADFPTLIAAVGPGDIPPRNGEPVLVKGEDQSLVIKLRNDIQDEVHGTPQPLPPKRKSPRPPKRRNPKPLKTESPKDAIVKGRPRKYMRGTENFWRRLFLEARANAGIPAFKKELKRGVMSDPSGLALYARRPAGFDETLLKAINAGLPVPHHPEDVDGNWVASTTSVLERSSDGVYITPRGLRNGTAQTTSQVLIFKSRRLHEVDFSDKARVYPFQFISSSASHSFAYRGYYGLRPNEPKFTGEADGKSQLKEKSGRSKREPDQRGGPPVGVFYELQASTGASASQWVRPPKTLKSYDTLVDITDEEPDLLARRDREHGSIGTASIDSTPATVEAPNVHLSRRETLQQSPDDHSGAHPPDSSGISGSRSAVSVVPLQATRKQSSIQRTAEIAGSTHDQDARVPPDIRASSHTGSAGDLSYYNGVEKENSMEANSVIVPGLAGENTNGDRLIVPAHVPEAEPSSEERASTVPASVHQGKEKNMEKPAQGTTDDHITPLDDVDKHQDVADGCQAFTGNPPTLYANQRDRKISSTNVDDEYLPENTTIATPKTKKRVSQKRRRGGSLSESGDSAVNPKPQKRKKPYTLDANALCRKIIVQLISETSGVVPNDPSTLRRISAARWQEAGNEDRPLLKTMKAAIKSLCETGKLRQVMFTYRSKTGMMLKRAVLFLPSISPQAQLVQEMKQKIIDAEPADYVPPEWTAEGNRMPLIGKRAHNMMSDDEDSPRKRRRASSIGTETATPAPRTRTPRRRRASPTISLASVDSEATRVTRSVSVASSIPPPVETPATGFLTLKVPRLGSLASVQIYNWRTETPVTALRFDTTLAPVARKPPMPARNGRKPKARTNGPKIVWANDNTSDFPRSLQDILRLPDLKVRFEDVQSDDANWHRFACEVELVHAWEVQESAFSRRSMYAFINHTVPPALYVEALSPTTTTFSTLIQFDNDHGQVEVSYPPMESWPVFAHALRAPSEQMGRIAWSTPESPKPPALPPPNEASPVRRPKRASKRKASDDDSGFEPRPKRGRGGARSSTAGGSKRRTLTARIARSERMARGYQYLRTMPEQEIYRIFVSVLVVRTLAGGLESYIDWPLVMTVFPDQTEDFIQRRWKTLWKRYSRDVIIMTENLQGKYIEALEANEVPMVNFQNLTATDWPGIVDWALKNLDGFNADHVGDLPATRDDFVACNNLTFSEPKRYHNLLGYGLNLTNPVKEDVVSSVVFGHSYSPSPSPAHDISSTETAGTAMHYVSRFEQEIADPHLHRAKSWIFATILTPEDRFDPSLAQTKLTTLAATSKECDALFLRALKVLQDEKLIQRTLKDRSNDRLANVRTWEPSRRLYERFEERRMITPAMLRRAASYKFDVLDAAFAAGREGETDTDTDTQTTKHVLFEKDQIVDDAQMVAVLNLMSQGMLRARPGADVPRTRYGLEHEKIGYQTRIMDKKTLSFGVRIVPTAAYVGGDPAIRGRKVPIPRGWGRADHDDGEDDGSGLALIPAWIDIHGNVQLGLWEMFVAGVVGLVSQMPGISTLEISRALGYALDKGEVDLLMQWCVQAGFVKVHDKSRGYETTEWWWLCIANGIDGGWEWSI